MVNGACSSRLLHGSEHGFTDGKLDLEASTNDFLNNGALFLTCGLEVLALAFAAGLLTLHVVRSGTLNLALGGSGIASINKSRHFIIIEEVNFLLSPFLAVGNRSLAIAIADSSLGLASAHAGFLLHLSTKDRSSILETVPRGENSEENSGDSDKLHHDG